MIENKKIYYPSSGQRWGIVGIAILCNIFIANHVSSQDINEGLMKKNSVYFGVLVNDAAPSCNLTYDRLLYIKDKSRISAGMGMGYLFEEFSISPQVNYLFGMKHHLETGIGLDYVFDTYMKTNYEGYGLYLRIGYRYQKPSGGLFFKIGFRPTYYGGEGMQVLEVRPANSTYSEKDPYNTIFPSGSIAFGWTF